MKYFKYKSTARLFILTGIMLCITIASYSFISIIESDSEDFTLILAVVFLYTFSLISGYSYFAFKIEIDENTIFQNGRFYKKKICLNKPFSIIQNSDSSIDVIGEESKITLTTDIEDRDTIIEILKSKAGYTQY
jgi:hypothetical protein